jgi:hypothetical protein
MKRFWISCRIFTVKVNVEDGVIVQAAPIVRKFVGQPLANLLKWQKCRVVDLDDNQAIALFRVNSMVENGLHDESVLVETYSVVE